FQRRRKAASLGFPGPLNVPGIKSLHEVPACGLGVGRAFFLRAERTWSHQKKEQTQTDNDFADFHSISSLVLKTDFRAAKFFTRAGILWQRIIKHVNEAAAPYRAAELSSQ